MRMIMFSLLDRMSRCSFTILLLFTVLLFLLNVFAGILDIEVYPKSSAESLRCETKKVLTTH